MKREDKIIKYYGLIEVILDKLLSIPYYKPFKYMRDDLHSEGMLGLIAAIDTYDVARETKEVTYISLKVRGYIINLIRKQRRYESPLIDIDDKTLQNIAAEEEEEYVEEYDLIEKYEPEDEINKAIYHRCIMGSTTCQAIADEFGINRDSAQKRKRRLLKRLKIQISNGEKIYED